MLSCERGQLGGRTVCTRRRVRARGDGRLRWHRQSRQRDGCRIPRGVRRPREYSWQLPDDDARLYYIVSPSAPTFNFFFFRTNCPLLRCASFILRGILKTDVIGVKKYSPDSTKMDKFTWIIKRVEVER